MRCWNRMTGSQRTKSRMIQPEATNQRRRHLSAVGVGTQTELGSTDRRDPGLELPTKVAAPVYRLTDAVTLQSGRAGEIVVSSGGASRSCWRAGRWLPRRSNGFAAWLVFVMGRDVVIRCDREGYRERCRLLCLLLTMTPDQKQ